jgi:hypothetical protein
MPEFRIKHEKDLIQVSPKDASAYEEVSLTALTAYSLYWLHQWELRRTIEAVAVLNWRLFPNKFAMMGFLQYPDAFRTNRSLLQGQPKYRNLLTGSATQGFSLNERGMDEARKLISRIGVPTHEDGTVLGKEAEIHGELNVESRARTVEPKRVVANARRSRLFEKWQQGALSDRDLIHLHSLLGVFDHTPAKVRQKKMKDLQQCAEDLGESEVMRFTEDVRQIFRLFFEK